MVGGLCSDSRLELKLPLNAALHLHDACAAKPFCDASCCSHSASVVSVSRLDNWAHEQTGFSVLVVVVPGSAA
jgi:hypothetical protein